MYQYTMEVFRKHYTEVLEDPRWLHTYIENEQHSKGGERTLVTKGFVTTVVRGAPGEKEKTA